jgi:glycosyltransferase involved in cell wall biosynthesis
MPEPVISVIIPARNEVELIGAALSSVADQLDLPSPTEVIVVSNGSDDATAETAREAGARLAQADLAVIVVEEAVPGIARAKNRGAARASSELLVFMDADSRMSPGLLRSVVARARTGERAASIRIVADGADAIDHAFFWVIENGKRLFGVRANMSWMRRDLFEQLGGFDETLNHAEDLDLLVRAKRAGVRVGHLRSEYIATSPRRLHTGPARLGMFLMLGRWAAGNFGFRRRRPY